MKLSDKLGYLVGAIVLAALIFTAGWVKGLADMSGVIPSHVRNQLSYMTDEHAALQNAVDAAQAKLKACAVPQFRPLTPPSPKPAPPKVVRKPKPEAFPLRLPNFKEAPTVGD